MLPIQYKASAGESWTSWTGGTVDKQLLDFGFGKAYAPYKISGQTVYSFKFDNGKIWNINDGWIN